MPLERRYDSDTVAGRVFSGLTRLIAIRMTNPVFSGSDTEFHDAGSDHVLSFRHHHGDEWLFALVNVSEQT